MFAKQIHLPPYAPSGLSLYFAKAASPYAARRMPVYLVNNSQQTLREIGISIRILSPEYPHVFVIPGIQAAAGGRLHTIHDGGFLWVSEFD
jgi:hypothetical protein